MKVIKLLSSADDLPDLFQPALTESGGIQAWAVALLTCPAFWMWSHQPKLAVILELG